MKEFKSADEKIHHEVLTDIKLDIRELTVKQEYMVKQLNSLEEGRQQDKIALEKVGDFMKNLDNGENYKKNIKQNLLIWLRIGSILLPIIMGTIGYIAYEAGLYKPIPQHGEQQ